jgi:SPP1 family predicted phage head-tail adaptor
MITAGRNKCIRIQERVSVPDGRGGQRVSWSTRATVRAAVLPATGREQALAQSVQMIVTHVIIMRYYDWVSETMRLDYNGRILEIGTILRVADSSRDMRLLCAEKRDGGGDES